MRAKSGNQRNRSRNSRSNGHLSNIINMAGGDIPHIKLHVGLTQDVAASYEVALIAAIGRGENGPLVNFTDGGEGQRGHVKSAETRAKLRAANLGKSNGPLSAEHRAKIGAAHSGMKRSEETKAKMSAASAGKPKSEEHRAALRGANLGKKLSAETRAKMSLARTGKAIPKARGRIAWNRGVPQSPEAIAKRTEARKAYRPTAEARAKTSATLLARNKRKRDQANNNFLSSPSIINS